MDEVADRGDLTLLLLLRVVEDQPVAVFFRKRRAHALGIGVAPVAFSAYLRKAHNDEIILFIRRRRLHLPAARKGCEDTNKNERKPSFFHDCSSFRKWFMQRGSRMDTAEPFPGSLSKDRPYFSPQ